MTRRPPNQRQARLRKLGLSVLDAALLGGIFAKWSYRCGLHGKLKITRHDLKPVRAECLSAPLTLAFASDFHSGPTTHEDVFEDLIGELNTHRPDVVLLGGDYVSSKAEYLDALCAKLSRYRPRFGTYGVLGNHDLWADGERVARRLTAAGIEVLVNRNLSLPPPYECVSVCGIDDPWVGRADVAKAFEGAGPVRIFLSHAPDALLLLKDEQFDVGFAGHTHGGQVALPDGTAIVSAGGPLSRAYGRGRFEIPGNGPLIVSRGIGCSNLPLRINSDPELVLCTLHS